MRHFSEEHRRSGAEAFLSTVTAVQRIAESVPKSNELPKAAMSLLVKAALEPGTFLLDMYAALRLHAAEGKQAQEDLVARGLVRLHRLVRKGRGGQPQVMEVTREGVVVLKARGISPAERLLKGGFKHSCYGALIGKWAATQSFIVFYERTIGVKCFDVVLQDKDGVLRGIEICLSGSAGWTAEQLMKAASVAGVVEVLTLCETQAFAKSVGLSFSMMDQLGLYKDKVKVGLLADYLE